MNLVKFHADELAPRTSSGQSERSSIKFVLAKTYKGLADSLPGVVQVRVPGSTMRRAYTCVVHRCRGREWQ